MSSFSVIVDDCLPCCVKVGDIALSCRTRGGTATLVGFDEFVSPSSPPKKYLRNDLSGGYRAGIYSDSICTNEFFPGQDETVDYTGDCEYDPITGILAQNGNAAVQSPGQAPFNVAVCTATENALNGTGCNFSNSASQTTRSFSPTGTCCGDPGGFFRKVHSAGQEDDLSDEDTEDNAIARLLSSNAGGTWSNYVPVGDGTGGTCVPSSCCLASWEIRTAGFSLGYQEAGFQANISNLIPSQNYTFSIQVQRRLRGAGPYALAFDAIYGFTTDGSGNAQITDDVTILRGFDTYVSNAAVNKV